MTPLQAEQLRRRQAGEAPLTPAEILVFLNHIDTATADANVSQIGSTKTTLRGGTKLIDGKYKGMHPRAATNAAITNAPVPTGKSGYVRGGPLSPERPSGLTPRAAPPSAAPMFSGMDTPAAPAASVEPSVTSQLLNPSSARPPMLNAGNLPPATSAPSPVASAAPAMARAITDQRDMGVMARDANGTQFNSGAVVSRGASPTAPRTLTSPYGSGSVTFSPPGVKPAGDSVLRAATDYAKQRQAAGQFGQIATPPAILAAAKFPSASPQTPAPTATAAPKMAQAPTPKAAAPSMAPTQPKSPVAPQAAPPSVAAPKVTLAPDRPVDPMLVDNRGLTSPSAAAPGNWQFKPLPEAQSLPRIAGRGDDVAARMLQVANPFTMLPTLKQGGASALPPMMGAQPTYSNAYDRLKGDSEVIKSAVTAGQIRPRKVTDAGGGTKIQVNSPVMRDTGQPVTPWQKVPTTKSTASAKPPAIVMR